MNNNPSFSSRHHPGDVVSKHEVLLAERHQDFLVLDRLQSFSSRIHIFLGQVSSLQIDSSGVIATIIILHLGTM